MVEKELNIGRWHVWFMFASEDYDDELVLTRLYDADASYHILMDVNKHMDKGAMNTGFTYTNSDLMEAVVVIGPSSSGSEFVNTFTHELYHLAAAIANSLGASLDGERPAYLIGDMAYDLIKFVCEMGCDKCHGV